MVFYVQVCSFNCTILELKLKEINLILSITKAFNCTILELKHLNAILASSVATFLPFNCTILELKHIGSRSMFADAFNCTILELKRGFAGLE